jgi:hypothetical protein
VPLLTCRRPAGPPAITSTANQDPPADGVANSVVPVGAK